MNFPYRFRLISLSTLAVFICYIDRINISVAAVEIQGQFGWDNTQLGLVLSSFFVGYIFTQYLGGFLADRYGGKRVLGYGVLLWSLFTILTPLAAHNGFFLLLLTRVLMGLGEGITFPAWHSLYARWVPFQERTRAIAFTNSGIPLGSIFAYIATPIIMILFGWEWAFYSFGALGILWFFFWQRNITSLPADHPTISKEELDYILAEAPASEIAPKLPPFKTLIKNKPLWAIIVAHFCANWPLFVLISWLPIFIKDGLGISYQDDTATFILLILIPSAVSVIFLNLGGYLSDLYLKKGYQTLTIRRTCTIIGFGGSALCLALIPSVMSIMGVMIMLSITNICAGIGTGGFSVNHADIGPKHTGSLMGISATIATIPGIVGVAISGLLVDLTGSFDSVFYLASAILLFGGTFYFTFVSTDTQFD
ncbi:ACS family MFS transporter [Gammaproteobacteria bacterium]|nr:ACS family MFS transporter [Gammaproteobacteria bacterium]|tara:strand:+ start:84 stop:1352 length:1269 start_codon:yes stop_codon:yes gene_type:complete